MMRVRGPPCRAATAALNRRAARTLVLTTPSVRATALRQTALLEVPCNLATEWGGNRICVFDTGAICKLCILASPVSGRASLVWVLVLKILRRDFA